MVNLKSYVFILDIYIFLGMIVRNGIGDWSLEFGVWGIIFIRFVFYNLCFIYLVIYLYYL